MQTDWLHRHQRQHCLLFFSGWGMDPTPFRPLPAGDCDVCLVHDYRQLQPLDLQPFADYAQLHLIGWSMGVWVAAHLLAEQAGAFASCTALGGTLTPIDGQRGIPPASYDDMLDHFGPEVLEGFYRNMFDDEEQLARFLANRPQRDLDALHEEMATFRDTVLTAGPARDIYTRKLITSRDRIFSGRNQLRAWGKGAGTVHNWPHFPFYTLNDWGQLLAGWDESGLQATPA
jgi:biotin synthesis protein BioG